MTKPRTPLDDVRTALESASEVDMDGMPNGPVAEGDPLNEAPPYDATPDGPDGGFFDPDDMTPILEEGALLPLNDSGNGRRVALYFDKEAMHVARVGWHRWDGRRWKLDPDGIAVQGMSHGLQELIAKELPYIAPTKLEEELFQQEAELEARVQDLRRVPAAKAPEDHSEKLQEAKDALKKVRSATWGKGSTRQRHLTFARSAGGSNALKNMLHEARPYLSRDVEDLDSDPLTVNTMSGVLRFTIDVTLEGKVSAMERLDHARELPITGRNTQQYITKMMPVNHDIGATCPTFDAFLARIQPDADMRAFLQRWFGLSMTGMPIQKFLYMYGMGANGKSVLANLMRRMMGDYSTMVKIQSLTGANRKSGADATPDMMKLIGARSAFTNEPEEGQRLQENTIKELTGGDMMMVRALHTDFVEFTPYFKLVFTGNHKLDIRGTDDGIWRRPLLCPFDVQIPDADRDEKMGDKLWLERDGILNWMIAGLLDYLQGGLQEPSAVLDATDEYRKDSDIIGDYLSTCCEMTGDAADWMSAADMIAGAVLYQLENDGNAWTPGTLSRRLKDRSGKFMHPKSGKTYTRHKRGVNGYIGVRFEDDFRRRLDAAPRDSKGQPTVKADGDGGYQARETPPVSAYESDPDQW